MAPPPKPIFVHEFFAGGGCSDVSLPAGLLHEGYAMLEAVLADFRRWGRFPVVATLDARLANAPLPADRVEAVAPGAHESIFAALAADSRAVLVIAPETDGILKRLTATVERMGVPLLGASSEAVEIAGDKLACYGRLHSAGLPVPATCRASFDAPPDAVAGDLRYPLVLKPVDGAGCEGVLLVNRPAELPAAMAALRKVTRRDDFVVSEHVAGTHASVSLLSTGRACRPLTLNAQYISVNGSGFAYHGGKVPLEHPLRERAFAVAAEAVSLIPGLRGYAGVDLVLSRHDAAIVEINPRLTTSIVGIRQVVDLNLAEAIWLACVEGSLPSHVATHGEATFAKDTPATDREGDWVA